MKKIIVAALIPILLAPVVAYAQWLTKTSDDIFNNGKSAMLIGTLNDTNSGVIFDCTKKSLSISYVEPDETSKVEQSVPIDLVVKIDKGDAVKFDAEMFRRNDAALGIEASDEEAIKPLLKALRDAKQKIIIGLQSKDGGNQHSFTGGVSNSTNAVNKFTDACEIKL